MAAYAHWTSTAISHIGLNLSVFPCNQNECTKPNPCYAIFACRLAKTAQITALMQAPSNDFYCSYGDINHASLLLQSAACEANISKSLFQFCIFLVNPNINLKPHYIFRKPMNRVSNDILSVPKYSELFTHESNTFSVLKICHSN